MTNLSSLWGLTLPGIPHGLGRHVETFGPNVVEDSTLGLFVAELTYTGVIVLVKLSILALYWRIFGKTISIRIPIYTLTAAVLMWGIAVVCSSPVNPTPNNSDVSSSCWSYCNVCLHGASGTRPSRPLAMSTAKSFFSPSRYPIFLSTLPY